MRITPLLFIGLLLTSCSIPDSPAAPTPSSPVGQSSSSITVVPVVETGALLPIVEPDPVEAKLPWSIAIDVPFSPQSPFGNWDDPYQEACEEMSLIMVERFLSESSLTPEEADAELLRLVAWQDLNGYGMDVNIEQLATIAEDFYGLTATIRTDVTEESIKAELAAGNPVILPVAGRELGNPYFSGEGPWYHMLVVTGYDWNSFITNEPGTKRGGDYEYSFDVLLNAVHDWTGVKEDIKQGRKVMLILERP